MFASTKIIFLALLLTAFAITSFAEDDVDDYLKKKKMTKNPLSGVWYVVSENSGYYYEVEFKSKQNEVYGICTNFGNTLKEQFGFKNGSRCQEGKVEDKQFDGKLLVHYPVSMRKNCPDDWEHWTDTNATLSADGQTLYGKWFQREMNNGNCNIIAERWVNYTLKRKVAKVKTDIRQDDKIEKFVVQ